MISSLRISGVNLPRFDLIFHFFGILIGISTLYFFICLVWSKSNNVFAQGINNLDQNTVITVPDPAPASVCQTDVPQLSYSDLRAQGSRRPASLTKVTNSQQTNHIAPETIASLINTFANTYRIDPNTLTKIAKCESGFNPGAVNNVYGGMYQFLSSTWSATRKRMGLDPNPDLRFNAEEAIKTAAFKISNEGSGAWPVCGK